jgi:hypothetical protein
MGKGWGRETRKKEEGVVGRTDEGSKMRPVTY